MSEHHNTVIIGAGLSGLYCAWKLQQQGIDVILLESRDRIGGRMLSLDHNQLDSIDMGPAWVWPDLQPRLQRLAAELNINLFHQHTSGAMLYEKNDIEVERIHGDSSHSQSYRITGGSQYIVDSLASRLSSDQIHLNTRVSAIDKHQLTITASHKGKTCQYTAERIILAIPPRLILEHINIEPLLADETYQEWQNTYTWMSRHCKILFIYDKPFWRDMQLSGEVFSHVGPLTEIYDATPESENFYALTSFVGVHAEQRMQIGEDTLIQLAMSQLHRLFGNASQEVIDIKVKDWSQDSHTTTDLDLSMPVQHPHYNEKLPRSFWDNRLVLIGTEVARQHGGYIEGALESVDYVLEQLIK